MTRVDRRRSVADIAELAGLPTAEAVTAFERLQFKGLVAFRLDCSWQPAQASSQAVGRVPLIDTRWP